MTKLKKNITTIAVVALHFHTANSIEKRLETHFDGTLHADGSIIEIVSNGQPVSITGFDVNMDTGTDLVSVFSRPGDLVAGNDGNWIPINSWQVTGAGKGLITTLPDFDYPVTIPAGLKVSFYIATNSTDIDFWYSNGVELGTVLSSNADLNILEGYAIGHDWRGFASPRQWNGAVHYTVAANVPTASPVLDSSSTSSPVSISEAPSSKPSSYPTLLPTSGFSSPPSTSSASQSPTKSPSKQPSTTQQPQATTTSPAPSVSNFKEPRSNTIRPTRAPASSSSGRALTISVWTALACLSVTITKWL